MRIIINSKIISAQVTIEQRGDDHIINIIPCYDAWERRRLKPLPEMNRNNPARTMREGGGDDGKGKAPVTWPPQELDEP